MLRNSVTLYNDGPADIYILDEPREVAANDAPMKINESVVIDFDEVLDHYHWIRTVAGVAAVRVFQTG